MKKCGFIFIFFLFAILSEAQPGNCILQPPQFTINFGTGMIPDPNSADLLDYLRVRGACPSDGHYSLVPYTSDCFRGDWHTISTDHTAGDKDGNMLLVNASYHAGVFLKMPVSGLKNNTLYELSLYMINLCRPTKKCPTLLLPRFSIVLQTEAEKKVANIVTPELQRVPEPVWTKYYAYFTTPPSYDALQLVIADNAPGGCGNDFAVDDITFRECIQQPVTSEKKDISKKKNADPKPVIKKISSPVKRSGNTVKLVKPKQDTTSTTVAVINQPQKIILPIPMILKTRENELVRKFEIPTGEIKINVYDNGEIDGDTVSIYHNNELVKAHMRLSQKPITINFTVNTAEPYHEIVMVADNLGSIPPNTSVMIITTPVTRYQVFISSNEQKNAKVVFELKR